MGTFERPALGLDHVLGALYDARTDTFLSSSIFITDPPEDATSSSWQQKKALALGNSSIFRERIKTAGIEPHLAASYLAGWVDLGGSGKALVQHIPDDHVYHELQFTASTIRQELNLDIVGAEELSQDLSSATHVVTQVLWGGCCVVSASALVADAGQRDDLSKAFAETTRKLEKFKTRKPDLATVLAVAEDMLDPSLSINGYLDLKVDTTIPINTLEEVKQHLETIFDIAEGGYYNALPLAYTLTPIHEIPSLVHQGHHRVPGVGQLSSDQFQSIVTLYESFEKARVSLETHLKRLKKNRTSARSSISAQSQVDCQQALEDLRAAETDFRERFPILLASVRAKEIQFQGVMNFVREFSSGPSSPGHFLSVINETSRKMNLMDMLIAKKAVCTDFQGFQNHESTARHVFYFSEAAMAPGNTSWKQNLNLVTHLLENSATQGPLVAVDCDTGGPPLAHARVSRMQNGKVVTNDIIEWRKRENSLCFVRFDEGSVDPNMKDAPAQHKSVVIGCPGKNCGSERRDWICQKCRAKVEFGVVDSFLYCDCGRAPLNSVSFHCQQETHGPAFARFQLLDLRRMLVNLPTPPEVNILILGETGVGKSTFINSLINYLSFGTLDEALSAKDLNCIIPCSFSIQRKDPSGRLVKREIRIGEDKDEADGAKGQSATQDSTVYSIYYGGGLVRLIDTPGIGDTRGKEQDDKNLMKILRVLRNYDKLHGILILLKPNNARLTIMFKFTIKELLTQLHKSAAQNIVFGFTNTRGSNYTAGDTFQPLETLLANYPESIPGLFEQTVYCFDSESFRYLAAKSRGEDIGHIDDYRRSWDHSATEARRMVEYFQNRAPHAVKSTVSLNETRHLITELIQPMARITNAIADTVEKSKKQIKDLENTNLTGRQLEKNLMTTKTIIDSVKLDMPQTVCSNSDCCTFKTDSGNSGATVTFFKSKCHNPCYLKDVPADVVGTAELPPCAAFNSNPYCQICTHHWKEHQHITIEYHERTETSTDPQVERALKQNTDSASAKKVQIRVLQTLIGELQAEHEMIQKSQARFSHYLHQNSITFYNDATIEYYEHLIKDEKTKVAKGGSRARLTQLETDKATYQTFVDAMKTGKLNIISGGALNEEGVYQLIQKLYGMKHYGSNLKDCARKTGEAYAATFRERSYRVRRRNNDHDGSYYSFSDDRVNQSRQNPPQQQRGQWRRLMAATRSDPDKENLALSKQYKAPIPSTREVFPDDYSPDDFKEENRQSFSPVRAIDASQPPTGGGVKNVLLEDDYNTTTRNRGNMIHLAERKSLQSTVRAVSDENAPKNLTGGGLLGSGSAVPVMLDSGDPTNPYGPNVLQRSRSSWLSSMKGKLKSKKVER